MHHIVLAMSLAAVFAPAHESGSTGWELYWEQELVTGPLQRINKRLVQNSGSSVITVPTATVTFYSVQRYVEGSESEDPPWPSWLKPISSTATETNTSTPTWGDPLYLNIGYEYRCDHRLRVETGAQAWYWEFADLELMELLDSTSSPAFLDPPLFIRNRYWSINSYLEDYIQTIT